MQFLHYLISPNFIENFQLSNKFKIQVLLALFVPFFLYFTIQQFYQFYINIYYHRKIRQVLKERQVTLDEFVEKYKNSVDKEQQDYILSCNLTQLSQALKQFKITSEEILITYALRAATIGAQLNLIADVNLEDSIQQAKYLDAQRKLIKDQDSLPEIYGIPMSVKDHITCKGLRYTGGMAFSLDLPKAEVDCNFVQVLKEQGAIFYCTSNVPQGMGAIESASRMWGKSLNPWNLERTTGGSSGGEGGLISARCSPMGIGSDAAGSIRIPSSFCGIYGFAPSTKRISLKRTVNLRKYDLHYWREIGCSYGPMGKCVDDLNMLCKSLFGKFKELDCYTPDLPWDEKKFQNTVNSKNLRIGYIVNDPFAESHPAQQNVIKDVVGFLKSEGHELIEIKENWTERFLITGMPIMQAHGMASNLEKTLRGEYPKKYYTLQVLMSKFPSFFVRFIGYCAGLVGEERMGKILRIMKNRNLNEFFQEVYKKELLIDEFTDFYKKKLKLDCIIAPVLPYPAIKHGTAELIQGLMGSTFTYNIMCMPAGFVPIRKIQKNEQYYQTKYNDMAARRIKFQMEGSEGLPVGVQVASFAYEDEICLGVMKKIENKYQFHEYPEI